MCGWNHCTEEEGAATDESAAATSRETRRRETAAQTRGQSVVEMLQILQITLVLHIHI